MDDKLLIWAAGLFDGEGCVSVEYRNPSERAQEKRVRYRLRVRVRMTHKPTIDRLHKSFGIGSLLFQGNEYNKNAADSYTWTLQGENAHKFLTMIAPHVFTKKAEVDLAIEFYEWNKTVAVPGRGGTKPEVMTKRHWYYEQLRELKHASKTRIR